MIWFLRLAMFFVTASVAVAGPALAAERRCLTECSPRIGIVSAFGAEADILIAKTERKQEFVIHGKRFTTGVLLGNPVVIVLSGVSMINSTLVTQQMLDHFHIERLIMSGISGGVDPAHHVGDVMVPDRWAMPMEGFWNADAKLPSPCGAPLDMSCLGLRMATGSNGQPLPPFVIQGPNGPVQTGLYMRENHVLNSANAPAGAFFFDYPVDPEMLDVARSLSPKLERCGPKARRQDGSIDKKLCVRQMPKLKVGGRGVTAPVFLSNPQYRVYLHKVLQAQTLEMETAGLAHVALSNGVPYIAFRSLSDLAGGEALDADAGALFASGLAESNEAAVTLAFLKAWHAYSWPR